ncbi:hypothetical protein HanRHA438_Chr08g0369951 [Helianthus annuus]|nr:hypothetical protein HanRHA438_Chr08g0369951 [Helianthus annuus]
MFHLYSSLAESWIAFCLSSLHSMQSLAPLFLAVHVFYRKRCTLSVQSYSSHYLIKYSIVSNIEWFDIIFITIC